jgi:hypothetical protein
MRDGKEVIAPLILTSALDGGKWLTLRPGKEPCFSLNRKLVGFQGRFGLFWRREEFLTSARNITPDRPVSKIKI